MVFRIPFSWEKGVIIWKWQSYLVSLWAWWLWSLGRLVLFLSSISSFVFHVAACIYTIVSGYHMLNMIVTCSDLFPHENYLKTGGMRGRTSAIIWGAHTVERSRASFQICLPCQEKALLQWQPRGVCYNMEIIWDAKLKSQSQVKNQGSGGVCMQHCSFLPASWKKLQMPCPSWGDTVRWPVPKAG